MPTDKQTEFNQLVIEHVGRQRRTNAILQATVFVQLLWLFALTLKLVFA